MPTARGNWEEHMPNKSSSSCENSFQLSKVSIAYLGKVALQTMGGCNSSQTYWSLKNSKVLPSTAVKIRAWSEKNLRRGKTTPVNLDAIMANIIVGRENEKYLSLVTIKYQVGKLIYAWSNPFLAYDQIFHVLEILWREEEINANQSQSKH